MNTQLSIHKANLPTFEYADFGTFVTLKMEVQDSNGDYSAVCIFLPEGTPLSQVKDALNKVEVNEHATARLTKKASVG